MMPWFGPLSFVSRQGQPIGVEIFPKRPAFLVEEMAPEEIDDACRSTQICTVAGDAMPGKEGFQHMHVRVREPHPLPARGLEETVQAVVFKMGVDEMECLLCKPQGFLMAASVSMGKR